MISIVDLHRRDRGACYYCGVPVEREDATRDHLVARSNFGSNTSKNIVLCCQSCNREKGTLTEGEYLARIARRLQAEADRKWMNNHPEQRVAIQAFRKA